MDKTSPITLNLTELTALAANNGMTKHVSKEGDTMAIDSEAAMAIRRLKAAQEVLSVAEKSIKDQLLAIGMKRHIMQFVGVDVNVAIKPAVQFEVAEGYIRSWCTPKITYTPNNDLIDSHVKVFDTLPEGVTIKETTPVVQIRVKK